MSIVGWGLRCPHVFLQEREIHKQHPAWKTTTETINSICTSDWCKDWAEIWVDSGSSVSAWADFNGIQPHWACRTNCVLFKKYNGLLGIFIYVELINTNPLHYQPKPLIRFTQTLLPASPKLATSWILESNSAKQGHQPIMCSCCQRSLKLSVCKLLCGLMVMWSLKPRGWGAANSSLLDNVELVRAQESIIKTSDDLSAILTADIAERRITAEHRICSHSSHIRFLT